MGPHPAPPAGTPHRYYSEELKENNTLKDLSLLKTALFVLAVSVLENTWYSLRLPSEHFCSVFLHHVLHYLYLFHSHLLCFLSLQMVPLSCFNSVSPNWGHFVHFPLLGGGLHIFRWVIEEWMETWQIPHNQQNRIEFLSPNSNLYGACS